MRIKLCFFQVLRIFNERIVIYDNYLKINKITKLIVD
jgi:hypothetical protein